MKGSTHSSRPSSPKIGNRAMGARDVDSDADDSDSDSDIVRSTRFVPVAKQSPTDSVSSGTGTRSRRHSRRALLQHKRRRDVVVVRQFSRRASAKYRVRDTGIELSSPTRNDTKVSLPSPVRRRLSQTNRRRRSTVSPSRTDRNDGAASSPKSSSGSPSGKDLANSRSRLFRSSSRIVSSSDDRAASSPKSSSGSPSGWDLASSRSRLFRSSSRIVSSSDIRAWTSSLVGRQHRNGSPKRGPSRSPSMRMRSMASVHSLRSLRRRSLGPSSPNKGARGSPGSVSPTDTPPRSPSRIGVQSKSRSGEMNTSLSTVSYGSWLATPAIFEGDSSSSSSSGDDNDDNESKVQQRSSGRGSRGQISSRRSSRGRVYNVRQSSPLRRRGTPSVVDEGDEEEEEDEEDERNDAVGSARAAVLSAARSRRLQQLHQQRTSRRSNNAVSSPQTSSDASDDSKPSPVSPNWRPVHERTAHLPPIPAVQHHGPALQRQERTAASGHPRDGLRNRVTLDVAQVQAPAITPPRSPFAPDHVDDD
eukprot:TRINITY_DN66222_c4_g6_i1.p1 TRINITY_DN66222_c4_g6~~TRINITY_DN66222_c4_g6_i1.p1  ORF type:complete len:566 (+),score=140.66 TRINITY_DN66222_c4_g6_i1:107-1699(+)